MIKKIIKNLPLLNQAFGRYKYQILIIVALGFLSGILEGIGINALIPLFSAISGESMGQVDKITMMIRKFFDFVGMDFSLKYILIFICSLFVLKAIVLLISAYVKNIITLGYEENTRNSILKNILAANYGFLSKQKLGYLDTVLRSEVQMNSNLFGQISSAIMLFTGLSMYILVALNISVFITTVTMGMGAVILFIFKPFVKKVKANSFLAVSLNKKMAHFSNEIIRGLKTIKSSNSAAPLKSEGKNFFSGIKKLKLNIFMTKTITTSLLQPISMIFMCIIFAIAYKSPNFQLASFLAIIYLIQKIFQHLESLQKNINAVSEQIPYLSSVLAFNNIARENKEEASGKRIFEFKKEIEFKNVGFFHDNDEILKNINLKISNGEMIGIIGPSGSGKTTIINLLLRLYLPKTGSIKLDGCDIGDFDLDDWRKKVGYVSQDVFLLNRSIGENIRFFENDASEEAVIRAAQKADIYEYAINSSKGFDTVVGENGAFLSGGQKQRIVIARALLRNPQLLLLDEATSALDSDSEKRIKNILLKLKRKITIVVVAHRLSTVENCDKLIVIKDGEISEYGTP